MGVAVTIGAAVSSVADDVRDGGVVVVAGLGDWCTKHGGACAARNCNRL